jgi:hypothetical protein
MKHTTNRYSGDEECRYKCKAESDIRIFKDWLSTGRELCNPKDIGVEEMKMHLEEFFQHARNPNRITN